jgi:hypothetical protein
MPADEEIFGAERPAAIRVSLRIDLLTAKHACFPIISSLSWSAIAGFGALHLAAPNVPDTDDVSPCHDLVGTLRPHDGDQLFASLSAAAKAVTGHSTNGWLFWRPAEAGEQ